MPKAETSRAEIPVAEHIKRFSPEIQRLIREVRTVVKKVAPKAEEKAYRGWPIRIRTEHGLVAIGVLLRDEAVLGRRFRHGRYDTG